MLMILLVMFVFGASELFCQHQETIEHDSVSSHNISTVDYQTNQLKDKVAYEAESITNVADDILPDSLENEIQTKKNQVIDSSKATAKLVIEEEKGAAKVKAENLFEGDGITLDNASSKLTQLRSDSNLSLDGLKDHGNSILDRGLDKDKLIDQSKEVLKKEPISLQKLPKDEMLKNVVTPLGKIENAVEIKDPSEIKRIFSDKELKFAYDSLLKNVDWNVVNAMLRDPTSVSDLALLEAVYVKFPGLKKISTVKQDASILSMMAQGTDPVRTLSSLAAVHLHDLPKIQAHDSLLSQLPVIRGSKLDTKFLEFSKKYWVKWDSIRKVNLKGVGLKLKESKLSNFTTESLFKRRYAFLQKFYFEGIIGLLNGGWNGNLNLFQFSPALGYHIWKNISLGVGPNLVLQQQKKLNAILGIRSFMKYELFKSNLYFQVEDNLMFPRVDKTSLEEQTLNREHAFLGGAGYLLPLSKKLSLNVSILYRFAGDDIPGINGTSPWIYRLGISSNKSRSRPLNTLK